MAVSLPPAEGDVKATDVSSKATDRYKAQLYISTVKIQHKRNSNMLWPCTIFRGKSQLPESSMPVCSIYTQQSLQVISFSNGVK